VTTTANQEAVEAWDGVLFDRFTEYRPILVDALGAQSEEALRLFPPQPGQRAIDLGCGFGDTTQRLAELVGPKGEAVGVDASPRFVETAAVEAQAAGFANCRFAVADVEEGLAEGGFDRAFSRMGTMFFANPVAAMRNVREALVPGGLLTMVVWRAKSENGYFHRAEQIAERWLTHPDQTDEPTCGPGPFSMANADTTSGILVAAGWADIALNRSDQPALIGQTVEQAVGLVCSIGPAGELIRVNEERGEEVRPEIEAAIADEFERYVRDDGVWAATSTWIVSARNPG